MTHEEVRRLLPGYAAGVLDRAESEAVRAHLMTGCSACLDDIFARPVGQPRAPLREAAPAGGPEPASNAVVPAVPALRNGGLGVAVVVLSLALAAAVGWMVVELRGREEVYRAQTERIESRFSAAESVRARLDTRIDALERAVAEAMAETARQAEAVRETAEEKARLEADLEAAREQIATLGRELRGREREVDRLRLLDADMLRGVLGSPAAELLRLRPIAPFRDVRGHVLWSPDRETAVVYAFALPPLPAGSTYRVRVGLDDGREITGAAFSVDGRGEAALRIATGTGRPRGIELVLEPANRPVLAWHRPPGE